jgi:hypothetical protein
MQELDDLRPTPPPWLKGIALAELALLVLIVEARLIATATGLGGLDELYLLTAGAPIVLPFGAAIGAFAPKIRGRRMLKLTALSLATLAATGVATLLVMLERPSIGTIAENVTAGTTLLVLPVTIAAALFVRWSPEPPAPLDVKSLVDTFE